MRIHPLVLCLMTCLAGQIAARPPAEQKPIKLPGIWTTSLVSFADAAKSQDAMRIAGDLSFQHGTYNHRTKAFTASPRRGTPEKLEVKDASITFYLDGAEEHAAFVAAAPNQFKTIADSDPPIVVYYHRQN